MFDLASLSVDRLKETVAANAVQLGAALNRCFESTLTMRPVEGDAGVWRNDQIPLELQGPGVTVGVQVGDAALLCLIPATPEWVRDPEQRQARLQTLANEWSELLLELDRPAVSCFAEYVDSLQAAVKPASGDPPKTLALPIASPADGEAGESGESADAPAGGILLVWPTAIAGRAASQPGSTSPPAAQDRAAAPGDAKPDEASTAAAKPMRRSLQQLLQVPVTVSVRVAEKRVEMDGVLKLTPGALIRFNKSCEELLELYVNNHRYCRGEAVKVGEKFGFRVAEVDVKPQYLARVING